MLLLLSIQSYFLPKKPAIDGVFVGWLCSVKYVSAALIWAVLPVFQQRLNLFRTFFCHFSQKSVSQIINPGTRTIVDKNPNEELQVLALFNKPLFHGINYRIFDWIWFWALAFFNTSLISFEVASLKDLPLNDFKISSTLAWIFLSQENAF